DGIVRGLYRFRDAPAIENGGGHAGPPRVTLLGSGSIMQQVLRAQDLLAERFGVAAEVWSAPSYQLLRADALDADHWNALHPTDKPRTPYVTQVLAEAAAAGPVVAASDYVKAVPDQISRWVPGPWRSLGTDGFGRSDTRENLRRFFGVDAAHIAFAALAELARCGRLEPAAVSVAVGELELDPEAPHSLTA
ncbi:MAG: transketolase-like TK C-terminal-containing protein, partial [Candidatus Limnocylindrales bacterium]